MRSRLVARLLWIFPAILLFLTVNQLMVALDLRETLNSGVAAKAEVLEIYKTNRVDVTYAYARLRYPSGEGTVERQLTLPISLVGVIEGRDSVDVRVRPGDGQDVVIMDVVRPQWRMAAINSGISFIGLILLTVGVWSWNRYLRQKGDPAAVGGEWG